MTRQEKIKAIAEAVRHQWGNGNPVTMETVASICPVPKRSVDALFRTAHGEIGKAAGLEIDYMPSQGYQARGTASRV